jgi:hypothetical protein
VIDVHTHLLLLNSIGMRAWALRAKKVFEAMWT